MKTINKLIIVAVLVLTATTSFGQCTFTVTDSQPFVESFDDGLECWTVEANGGNWSAMTGSSTTLAAFSASNNVDEAYALNAYVNPNPTTGKITVNTNVSDGKALVYDVFGRQITDAAIIDGHAEIDLKDYASGVYFVRVSGDLNTATVRSIKE
ncbi:MAG: T9SS type A sorting domain-containing protein [Bacteroidales bacterium]|nr:T9SS type A sorting domain-containing protein [Bacteroidales bacterium]